MKTALLQALQYCDSTPNLEILMTIHDSVLFQATPDADLGEFRRVLEDMSNFYQIVNGKPVPMKIPFPVDIGVGANWALASYGAKA
jgi:DNA polymerase I-like protein with 3'-5' exonuclease and polymerase domains